MTKPLIDQAVDRFLGWKLPEDFSPDAGISFKQGFNEGTPFAMNHEPSGTNLFHAGQAKAMLEHVAEPMLTRIAELEATLAKWNSVSCEVMEAVTGISCTTVAGAQNPPPCMLEAVKILAKSYEDAMNYIEETKVPNILTCVYCGMAYPEGTPPHGAQILTDHIKVCERHPMRQVENELHKAERLLAEATTKGGDLCQAYGVSLLHIHRLEAELGEACEELDKILEVAEGRMTVPLDPSTSDVLRAVQKVVQSKNSALVKKKK
jgi:hypothetical protein